MKKDDKVAELPALQIVRTRSLFGEELYPAFYRSSADETPEELKINIYNFLCKLGGAGLRLRHAIKLSVKYENNLRDSRWTNQDVFDLLMLMQEQEDDEDNGA